VLAPPNSRRRRRSSSPERPSLASKKNPHPHPKTNRLGERGGGGGETNKKKRLCCVVCVVAVVWGFLSSPFLSFPSFLFVHLQSIVERGDEKEKWRESERERERGNHGKESPNVSVVLFKKEKK